MRQRFRQSNHREFRGRIGAGAALPHLQACHRGSIDDMAALAVTLDAWHERLDAMDHTIEVDAE
jgi:hypothetical protein